MTDGSIPQKQCNRCENWFPATPEYFKKASREPNGVTQPCRSCALQETRQYYADPEVKTKEKARKSTPEYKAKERKRKRSPEYREKERQRDRERYDSEARAIWWQEYKSRPEVQERAHARNTSEEKRAYSRNYQRRRRQDQAYVEHEKAYKRSERAKAIYRGHVLKRRAVKRALPHDFTAEDEKRALEFFGGRCPVCDRQFYDLFGDVRLSWDHWWIPQSKGGGYTRDNILPLCSGKDGCNNSKCNREPQEWLISRYGKRKAKQILERIRSYFDSLDNPP